MQRRVAVIQFGGTNREYELVGALKSVGLSAEMYRWNEEKKDKARLRQYDGFGLAGGFSYQDRGRAGLIASKDRLMDTLREESEKGRIIFGICNGCQILVEARLVPNIYGYSLDIGMAPNAGKIDGELRTGFISDWVYVVHTSRKGRSAATKLFEKGEILPIPIAHAEGRFKMPDSVLQDMIKNDQILWRYCTKYGEIVESANPNGSTYNAAVVCNNKGNVIAGMPHQEAANYLYQMSDYVWREKLEAWGDAERMKGPGAWRRFFESLKLSMEE